MRIDYETLVGLGVMPDVARGIVNDLSMRRMQAQESGVEVDDSLTFENLKGLGMSDEQAKGLMNDASLRRIQQQESAAALAESRAEADELEAQRRRSQAALMGRKEEITANLEALARRRIEEKAEDDFYNEKDRLMLAYGKEQADRLAKEQEEDAFDADAAARQFVANVPTVDWSRGEQAIPGVTYDTYETPESTRVLLELGAKRKQQEQEAKARATREAELANLELGVQQGQAQVDSLYNRAAIQALMNASQPIRPRTWGEAMKGTPTTAQSEMQQNINLAREFFGRQGKVQRSKMKELEAQRRMQRHRDKEKRMRDQMEARQKRFEASEERKEQAHLDRIELQEMLYGPEGTKTALAIEKLNKMTQWQQALLMERRLTRHAQLKMAQSKEGRAYLRDKASSWDKMWRQKQGEARDARRRADTARRDLERTMRSIERWDSPEKQSRKSQLESTIFQAEERASAAERQSKIYERSAANAQRMIDSTQGRFGGTGRNTVDSLIGDSK